MKLNDKAMKLAVKTYITLLIEESLNNRRQITRLNRDYKILAAVLANRLHKVIPNIYHENQVIIGSVIE